MDDIHSTHRASGIVEDPFLLVIDVTLCPNLATELIHDELDHSLGVVPVRFKTTLRNIMHLIDVEDVKGLEVLLEEVHDRGQDADQERNKLE